MYRTNVLNANYKRSESFTNTKASRSFKVFPNPSDGTITVRGLSFDNVHSFVLRIFSLTRGMVYSESYRETSLDKSIDLSDLPAGVYIIEVVTSYGIFKEEIIIK